MDLEIAKISKQCKGYGGMNDLVKQYLGLKYNSIQIFTDGSKDPNAGKTGAAFYIFRNQY